MNQLITFLTIVFCILSCRPTRSDIDIMEYLREKDGIGSVNINFDTLFTYGQGHIIKFEILGSHELPYVHIKKGKQKKEEVLEEYFIQSLVKEVGFAMKQLSESEKIDLYGKMLRISESHLKMVGWDVLEDCY